MATYNGSNANDSFDARLIQIYEPWLMYGNDGNDTLIGSSFNDSIYGGNGDDFIDGGFGFDLIVGGNGVDTVSYNFYSGGINANLATGVVSFPGNGTGSDTVYGVENLIGSRGSDRIVGSADNNVIKGGDGNDSIYGDWGNDSIYGENGDDFLDGGLGFDLIDGGAGVDTVTYDFYSFGINANLATGVVTFPAEGSNLADTLRGVENIIGSYGSDVITGSAANNFLSGGDGNDTLNGGAGSDTLNGGTGNNLLNGGAGNDTFYVNSSGDVVVEAANSGTDTVYSTVNYTLTANVETLILNGSATIGTGNNLNNIIFANNNGNTLNGGDGKDTLIGGTGNDYLNGGTGNDVLNAYGGSYEVDNLAGGTGADKFIMGDANRAFYNYPGLPAGNYDYAVIADFKVSEGDKLQLHGNSSNYLLSVGGGTGYGTGLADTFIYYSNGSSSNLVAILADVSNLSLASNSVIYV
ncbi:calcium-binding protein [Chroococcus sp. FPU101]|uniref:calcium-binding protein n=1 Tax=Chroococcus sp. FPU101 TaxID=1974212 RepID=UPI001A8ED546|nr:calcium-binding protein [Chroococcus sp. FPU101]GFE68804.1 hypothetical protein CFPU101_14140 [Chroococcus sp. FPU101]